MVVALPCSPAEPLVCCPADPCGAFFTWAFSSSISCCRMRSFSSVLCALAFVATPQAQHKANANAVFFIVPPSQVWITVAVAGWAGNVAGWLAPLDKGFGSADRASRTSTGFARNLARLACDLAGLQRGEHQPDRGHEHQAVGDERSVRALGAVRLGGEVPVCVVDRKQVGLGRLMKRIEDELQREHDEKHRGDLEEQRE